jgi:hypothetical protein
MPDTGGPALFAGLRGDAAMCGLATQGLHFSGGGGYAYLHRAVPMFAYAPEEGASLRADRSGFNRLIAPASPLPLPGYTRAICSAGTADAPALCVFTRPDACRPIASGNEINRLLKRIDQ